MILHTVFVGNYTFAAGALGCNSNVNLGSISTRPELPRNKLASNFNGLMLATRFAQKDVRSCSWNLKSANRQFAFVNSNGCFNSTDPFAEVQCYHANTDFATVLFVKASLSNRNGNSETFSITCAKRTSNSQSDTSVTPARLNIGIEGKNVL